MSDPRRLMANAWAAFRSGRMEEARTLLAQVIAQDNSNAQARVALGMVLARLGLRLDAIEQLQAATSLDPSNVPALNWLTVLNLEMGEAEQALESATKAHAIDPSNAEIGLLLGRSHLATGAPQEALALFDKLVESHPRNAAPRFGRADALEALSREPESAAELRRALALDPQPEGFARLAKTLLILGFPEQALEQATRSKELNPNLRSAHVLTARALTEMGRITEAETHWADARKLETNPGTTSCEKALALRTIGRFEDAIRGFEQSIQEQPRQGTAYHSLVYSKRISESDRPMIEQIEQLVRDPSLDNDSRVQLEFALGKSYDNLGDFERAMHRYDEANRELLERHQRKGRFDQAAYRAVSDRQIGRFPATPAAEVGDPDIPIFVVGMMRSGTTLVEQILSCHSQVGAAGEQPFWVDQEAKSTIPDSRAYLELLRQAAPGFSRITDKNPANFLVAGVIHKALPNARIIHVHRNPVDTALSIWTTPMGTPAPFMFDKSNIVFAYREYQRLMQHWRQTLPQHILLDVSYENLLENPKSEIQRMLDFCGLDWEAACLHPENNNRAVRTPSMWQVRQPLNKGSIDRWKRYDPWLGAFRELLQT